MQCTWETRLTTLLNKIWVSQLFYLPAVSQRAVGLCLPRPYRIRVFMRFTPATASMHKRGCGLQIEINKKHNGCKCSWVEKWGSLHNVATWHLRLWHAPEMVEDIRKPLCSLLPHFVILADRSWYGISPVWWLILRMCFTVLRLCLITCKIDVHHYIVRQSLWKP